MKLIRPTAVALVATLGIAGAFAMADAQTQSPNPPAAAGQQGPGPRGMGADGMGPSGMGPGWMRGDGAGWRMGGWGMGGWGPGDGAGPHWRHAKMSKEDRAAFLNARIAAVHAGLALSPEQEKLWAPVESAMRDAAKSMADRLDKAPAERPKDPIEGMKLRADMQIARGEAMKKVADAAAPLYAALTQAQKDRLPALMRPGARGQMGQWMHQHGMRWGWGRGEDRG